MRFDLQGQPLSPTVSTESIEFETIETSEVQVEFAAVEVESSIVEADAAADAEAVVVESTTTAVIATEILEDAPESPSINIAALPAAANPSDESRGWNCFSGLVISVVSHAWIMVALSGFLTGPTRDLDRGPAQITVDTRFSDADAPQAPQPLAVAELQAFIDETVSEKPSGSTETAASESLAADDQPAAEDTQPNQLADTATTQVAAVERIEQPAVAEPAPKATPKIDTTAVALATAAIDRIEPKVAQPIIPQSATEVKLPLAGSTIPVSTTIQAKYSVDSIVKPSGRISSGSRGSKANLGTKLATCEACTYQKLGTKIAWAENADAAAKPAVEQQKLVFLIQVSGNFAREEFT